MLNITIDPHLVEMIRARRVIPFIGAGFSAALDFPEWETLLGKMADEIEGALPYNAVAKYCSNDPLQIAEYYLLLSDKNIGPIRHAIEQALKMEKSPILSGAHVELVNLGAPYVYTTNFDDLIEQTYRDLGVPFEVVALPKDVATASEGKTQIVKYHGDLRHENTLVLTESSYYSRLDFESPMDLKFRSDLLGRSVLFMGYSFRDINIRIIWFKLMKMMKDIPQEDRPTSFIVRLTPNPVLEKLYESVGIKTIVLDPENKAKTNTERSVLLSSFMLKLVVAVSPDAKIPGTTREQFVSEAFISSLRSDLGNLRAQTQKKETMYLRGIYRRRFISHSRVGDLESKLSILDHRDIPSVLQKSCTLLLNDLAVVIRIIPELFPLVVRFTKRYIQHFEPISAITYIVSLALTDERSRQIVCSTDMSWDKVWVKKINADQANIILNLYEKNQQQPIFMHEQKEILTKIAYLTDPVCRIASGELVDKADTKTRTRARRLLASTYKRFPLLRNYKPPSNAAPAVNKFLKKILVDRKVGRSRVLRS